MSSPKIYADRSESHAQLLALYENTSKNIENIKKRSWQTFYLFALFQGYLFSSFQFKGMAIDESILHENIAMLKVPGIISAVIFYFIGLSLRKGCDKYRDRLDRIYAKFSNDFRACRGHERAASNDFGDSFIWWLLVMTYMLCLIFWIYIK